MMRVSCLLVRSSDFLTSVSRTWVSVIISFQERRARLLQMCLELSIVSRRKGAVACHVIEKLLVAIIISAARESGKVQKCFQSLRSTSIMDIWRVL